jgi:hypothetical protein
MQLTPRSFWFSLNQTGWVRLLDALTGASLNLPRGNTTRFLFGFFNGDIRRADRFATDLSNVASCTLVLRRTNESGELLYVRVQPASEFNNTGCTYEQWISQSNYQVEFELSSLETNWPPLPDWNEKIWMAVEIELTDGSVVTVGYGTLQLVDPGMELGDAISPPYDAMASQSEAEQGVSNIKWMSPLRVFQAISAWVTSNMTWTKVSGKPAQFPPTAHTHPISDIDNLQTALDGKQPAGSYAPMVNGLVPSSVLPGYVDDVLEFANISSFPQVGETGKIYVDLEKGWIYRWSGSTYIEIVHSPGSTDVIPEGATNKYFTAQRAINALSSTISALVTGVRSVCGKQGDVTLGISDISGLQTSLDNKLSSASGVTNIVVLTKASYDALPSKSVTTLYIVTSL